MGRIGGAPTAVADPDAADEEDCAEAEERAAHDLEEYKLESRTLMT